MKKKYRNKLPKGARIKQTVTYVENGDLVAGVEFEDVFQPIDGDFLIDTDGDIFIYSDAKTQNSNFYSCYCGTHHGKIRAAFCYNWVDKNGCRFATPEEKDAFIIRLEKEYHKRWNAEKKCLEDIRWRAAVFEEFCYVDSHGDVCHRTDDLDDCSNNFYDIGNYFRTEEAAQKVADQIKEIFKNSKAE